MHYGHDLCMSSVRSERRAERTTTQDVDLAIRACRAFVAIAAESVAGIDEQITLPQLRVLIMIATRGALNIAAVADGLMVNPSNASRTCDRLVRSGLLDRQESAADRRNTTLSLTLRGTEVVGAIRERRRAAIERVLRTMGSTDRRVLIDSLDVFVRATGETAEYDALPMLWVDGK